MAYERQYYTNGDVLEARQLNHMEIGIKENSDNIDKLSEDIATKASAIKETASGEAIVVTDSDEQKPLGLAIDGKSEQTQLSGKNFLPNKGTTQTIDGVSFDVNDNGIVILNGTATKDITFYIATKATVGGVLAETGSYVLNGCPSGGSEQTYRLAMWGKNENGGFAYDYGNGANVEFTNVSGNYNVVINITSGYTANNLVFKPMFSVEGGEYEPYCGGKPSPNTEYEQKIRNIGKYDEASGKYAVEVKCTGKNLLQNTLTTQTVKGVTITKNEDGTVTANGTATEEIVLVIATKKDLNLTTGKYVLNGCPSEGSGSKYFMNMYNHDGTSGLIYDTGTGVPFDFTNETSEYNVAVNIAKGYTANNLVFKPMIRLAEITDDTYEPYKETTATVYLDEPLRKGDKAYWNGGSKVKVDRNRTSVLFDGVNIKFSGYGSSDLGDVTRFMISNPTDKLSTVRDETALSDSLIRKTDYSGSYEHFYVESTQIWFFISNDRLSEYADINAYLMENPIEVEYALAEPITEEIDIDLGELSMFYPTTILSNDCNANMEVTYIADTKAYIDKKFAELATAML